MTILHPISPSIPHSLVRPAAQRAAAPLRAGLRAGRALAGAIGLSATLLGAGTALAQMPIAASPDTTVRLGAANVVVADENVAVDNQLGIVVLENLGPLPAASEVTSHAADAAGDRYFSLETTTSLSGGLVVRPHDVVRYDGASYSLAFDGSAAGIPSGVAVDAVSISPGGLLLSFDTTVNLGSGVVAADEDLVRWNGAAFSMAFDGSSAGLSGALDVDGAQDLGGGAYLISLDTSGSVGGIHFDDEDVLRYDGASWSLEFDGSVADADWRAADLDALMVPEPGVLVAIAAGATMLAGFADRRRRARSA